MKFNSYLLELWARKTFGQLDLTDSPVLVLEAARVAYLPIPKAANTSIRTALLPGLGMASGPDTRVHRVTKDLMEPSSKFFSRVTPDWFVFTVVRDPASRSRSAWRNKLIEPETIFKPLQRMGIRDRLSYPEFLQRCLDWPEWALNDHFMPQSTLLGRARKAGSLNVFQMEDLKNGWPIIQSTLAERGVDAIPDLPTLNATRHVANAVEPQVPHLLERLYGKDYDTFRYPCP